MILKFGDRVRESTITIGTATYVLEGTIDPLENTFSSEIGDGNYCYYCCEGLSDWEIGYGLFTDNGGAGLDTLSRLEVFGSSNNGQHVIWGAGGKTIYNTATARSLDHIAGFVVNKSDVSFNRSKYIATEGQTTFDFTYLPGSLEVRVDGLVFTEDQYTADNGTTVILNSALTAGQVVEFMAIGQYTTTHSEISTPVPTGQVFKSGEFFNDVWRDSSKANDGIAVDCVRSVSKSGVDGDKVSFNGTSSIVSFTDLGLLPSSAFTISFWLNTKTLADATVLGVQSVDDADGYLKIATEAAGNLSVNVLDSTDVARSSTISIASDTEYHVAVVYDGTDLVLWLNGVAGTPLTVAIKTLTPTTDLSLGGLIYPSSSSFCACELCGVNIYDSALSDTDIADIYSEPNAPDATTLTAVVVPGGAVATQADIISMVIALS